MGENHEVVVDSEISIKEQEEEADEEYEEYNEVNEEFLFDADNVELQEVREDLKNLQKERLVLFVKKILDHFCFKHALGEILIGFLNLVDGLDLSLFWIENIFFKKKLFNFFHN